MGNIEEMRTGYLGLLDVLGFSDLVAGDHTGSRIKGYLECVETAVDASSDSSVQYVVFSDSIVITGHGEDTTAFLRIARACARLFWYLIANNIAVRGSISFGRYHSQTFADSAFVAGRPVIDAYNFEKQQDWVGVMIAPSAREQMKELEKECSLHIPTATAASYSDLSGRPLAAHVQRCPSIPFHAASATGQTTYDGFAVVPNRGIFRPGDVAVDIECAVGHMKWLLAIAPTPREQNKHSQAIRWLEKVARTWNEIAEGAQRLKYEWVG